MEIDKKMLQLLTEIGFFAAGNGFFVEAEKIFEGIQAVRSESEYPHIGLAWAKINAHKPEEAIAVLKEKALKLNPDNDLAKSYLGLALRLANLNHESESVLQEVVESGRNAEAVNMARAVLEEEKLLV